MKCYDELKEKYFTMVPISIFVKEIILKWAEEIAQLIQIPMEAENYRQRLRVR